MYVFITILIIIICFLLGAVVLVQNPKGGGLSSSFGGVGQQLLGARRSTDIVEKLTWGFAGALIVLCLSTTLFVPKAAENTKEALPKSDIELMNKGFSGSVPTTNQPAANPAQQPQQAPAGGAPQGPPNK